MHNNNVVAVHPNRPPAQVRPDAERAISVCADADKFLETIEGLKDPDYCLTALIIAINRPRWVYEFVQQNPNAPLPNGLLITHYEACQIWESLVQWAIALMEFEGVPFSSPAHNDYDSWICEQIQSVIEDYKKLSWSDASQKLSGGIQFSSRFVDAVQPLLKSIAEAKAEETKRERLARRRARAKERKLERKQEQQTLLEQQAISSLDQFKNTEYPLMAVSCEPCRGTGQTAGKICNACHGKGEVYKTDYRKADTLAESITPVFRDEDGIVETEKGHAKVIHQPKRWKGNTDSWASNLAATQSEDQDSEDLPPREIIHGLLFSNKTLPVRAKELNISLSTLNRILAEVHQERDYSMMNIREDEYKCRRFYNLLRQKLGKTARELILDAAKKNPAIPSETDSVQWLLSPSDRTDIPDQMMWTQTRNIAYRNKKRNGHYLRAGSNVWGNV
jgi:hypothetical protein